ncbi:hypothetical protein J3P71_17705 [Rhizobium leguminosarum]|uniref:hypothetical protein n=1 Tax=Rhizobium leguminosarum TaxID=384 RepID=UPI001442381A|nr:hypothetical protein [Rhizobium leguminosarum]MBY5838068.1 hypothetical protein [Rhizobium leguminosarum]NKM82243.1 hypothetical protein [Rhizobium leguminosarum bv. viciae]QSZ06705.1 hypothetical protein J3P71_17705 [Rhizobium leguminosarum]
MGQRLDALTNRADELKAEIAALVDQDVVAVMTGTEPANSDKILRLTQDMNIINNARERLRAAD